MAFLILRRLAWGFLELMGIAYVAKEPAPVVIPLPEGWPDGWDFPSSGGGGAWPPSWPMEIEDGEYTVSVAAPESIYIGEAATVEASILDSYEDNTGDLEYHLLKVSASISGVAVQIKKQAGDDFSDALYYQATNYSGEKYGISESIYFDLWAEDGDSTVTVTCEILSVDKPVSASDTSSVSPCVLMFTTEPSSVTRGINFSLALSIENGNGTVMTDLAPETTLTLSGAATGDELNIVSITEEDWSDGEWSSSSVNISGGTGDVAASSITASVIGYANDSTELFEVRSPELVFTTEPESVTRGVDFTLSVEAQDGYGSIITGETGTITLALSGADESDTLSVANPTLSAGSWISSVMQITGGVDEILSATIFASLDGYDGDESGQFVIDVVQPTVTSFGTGPRAYVGASPSWEAANSAADTRSIGIYNIGELRLGSYYGGYQYSVERGGKKASGVRDVFSSLSILYEKDERGGFADTIHISIRYSHSAPSVGGDLIGGTEIAIIAIESGDDGVAGSIDGSVAIDGDSDIYIWAVAVSDFNDSGYPAWSGSPVRVAGLLITDLVFYV